MNIWITRHGQTDLNKENKMQGRIDIPLNETGIAQASAARERIGDVHFDAVYSSPLKRARLTASIIGGVPEEDILIDERLIETDFGPFDCCPFREMSLGMKLYWFLPELFPAPKGVETVKSMVERSASFLSELEKKPYENVLVTCHGGIIRALKGYLSDRKNGILWRPRPKNCEIRVFSSENGRHSFVKGY